MLQMHEPEYLGLLQVISGGQSGADQGGLEAALKMGVRTGGTAPKGWITCKGAKPDLGKKYGLIEDAYTEYGPRTRKNIDDSDGTLIIASNPGSPGSRMTLDYCVKTKKPFWPIRVERDYTDEWLRERVSGTVAWLTNHNILVLNVAGNRDNFADYHHHLVAEKLVSWVLLDLYHQGKLVTDVL